MILVSSKWNQWDDLPPEEESMLIEKYANYFVDKGMGTIVQMVLESGGPITKMFAEFYMGLYGPYFDVLGIDRLVALLRRNENIEKLINRIEVLENERNNKIKADKVKKV